MPWLEDILNHLARASAWGYDEHGPAATEAAAIAALALTAHARGDDAQRPGDWLTARQSSTGCLGIASSEADPHWPTALAVLAWSAMDRSLSKPRFSLAIDRAIGWLLSVSGKPLPRSEEVGHDTTLVGWPWVEGTHSWVEPTAMSLLALRATGNGDHPRAQEATRLLVDRLLPDGGANCGNTLVLGNWLMPHVQPSGLVLLALVGASDPGGRIDKTIAYVRRQCGAATTASSLAYGMMGLAAHRQWPEEADQWFAASAARTGRWEGAECRRALLALAAAGANGPLVTLAREKSPA